MVMRWLYIYGSGWLFSVEYDWLLEVMPLLCIIYLWERISGYCFERLSRCPFSEGVCSVPSSLIKLPEFVLYCASVRVLSLSVPSSLSGFLSWERGRVRQVRRQFEITCYAIVYRGELFLVLIMKPKLMPATENLSTPCCMSCMSASEKALRRAHVQLEPNASLCFALFHLQANNCSSNYDIITTLPARRGLLTPHLPLRIANP